MAKMNNAYLSKYGLYVRKKHKRFKVNMKAVLLEDKDLGIKKYFRYWRAESVKALEEAGRYRAFQEHIKIMEVLDKLGVLGV